MKTRKRGLSFLSPRVRLVVVFTSGCLYIFINNIPGAILFLLVGIVIYLVGENRNWKLVLAAPITGAMMFFYNVIFSARGHGGWQWLVFTVNQAGFERGLVMGTRIIGAMLISFAWLLSTSLPEMYEGLSWIKPAEPWVLTILRGVQIIKREFVALTQSLIIRGLKWDSPIASIRNLIPLAMAIIPRVIDNTQKGAAASLSHTRTKPEGNGDLILNDVHVRYSPLLPDVLTGINLRVDGGEFIYLAGRSGSGKTTLLRVVGGIISSIMGEFMGSVTASGMNTMNTSLAKLSGSVRYISPDPFASFHGLTVGQEITFLAENEISARRTLEIMGIGDLWEKEITKLSGGQQVRLVLAGILASTAKILLFDSPMQELDPQGRQEFLSALKDFLVQNPCTVIIADPFWSEIKPFVTRVVTLEKGTIAQDVLPGEFFTEEMLSRYSLLREFRPPMSVIPGEIIAKMDNVYVELDGTAILNGISLDLREGELVVVMGPNGSGKTTAMLTLAGAIKPIKGNVKARGGVGYVFQNASLQTISMTVNDELSFSPKIQHWDSGRIEAFVTEGIDWTGLEPLSCPLDLHPSEVEMLAISASTAGIQVLILDEPTIGLDADGIAKVLDLVQALIQKGIAVVIVTHDQQVAKTASRVVIINMGKITYDGPVVNF
ncbi:hypothetical protein COT44_04455 [Candidatus Shapirobacteria bacterium CG08_land_8_20_14_0_20_39_18]|uniref:ABC transporter domain-containing protein n=1 Tax=Candidatus Shapirobacteria bacterium CG08_land_8_20_14_0_20_39_18 TaxID=1974883 RepID=A0A2M6XBT2_9BACT|nr:MAG: hypothetical protein COT44_04455 [Candidatus Shapirobacteria bacterium CG08_land_8_20_14_0_20_39_18]PIY65310.1 MAG: hypothetical protein COY91_02745 [Candidatus Shapirobacteria bacterium CG_4_10_14_0_8_um_filter_39_15]PJE68464.1 MAG: hypothetical protein COU94_01545 [Candidatus Shapirobacteria bacterium CG10_big_fil_rev_8_21_14_0_10_38_8]